MKAKIAVIQFPGSNCERETILAVERVGMTAVPFLWNASLENFKLCDGYIIVGGFSYEDRSRAGIVAALDPVLSALKAEAALGKPVLGICNGAQILVESGLVPGVNHNQVAMALTCNKRIANGQVLGTGFYNDWVNLRKADVRANVFTNHLKPGDFISMPAAHAEGRFVMSDEMFACAQAQQLVAFQYCDDGGDIVDEFPVNPNGSVANIAAVCNVAGNVMAIMPHPERTSACDAIFASMRDAIVEGFETADAAVSVDLPMPELKSYQSDDLQLFVQLLITDNLASRVEAALQQLGIPATVKRFVHWDIDAESDVLSEVVASGELLNTNKESYSDALSAEGDVTFLVRERDDVVGQQKQQTLRHHFQLDDLNAIRHGIIWQLSFTEGDGQAWVQQVMKSGILFNTSAHEVYLC